jgi:hypothetical protein
MSAYRSAAGCIAMAGGGEKFTTRSQDLPLKLPTSSSSHKPSGGHSPLACVLLPPLNYLSLPNLDIIYICIFDSSLAALSFMRLH